MNKRPPVSLPTQETIPIKIGKPAVRALRSLATRESIRRMDHVTIHDLVREALSNTFPEAFGNLPGSL